MTYIITGWDKHFENNRTRGIKNLLWVPVPNKQDGDGYTEIMADKNGAAVLGCWLACLELASRCDPRGTLLRGDGTPHDIPSISRITRVPEPVLRMALPVLINVGWVTTSENPAPSCGNPAPSCIEGKGIEGNRREEKGTGKNPLAAPVIPPHLSGIWPDFLEFRKKKKAPMTDKAVTLILKTLSPHPPDIQVRMLEQTIERGWSGVFELKTDFKNKPTSNTTPSGGVKPKEGKYKDL